MNKFFLYSLLALIVLKIGAAYYTDFSLYGDEAQYWFWSQNLDLGYYSKPPLLAWFLSGHTMLFGDSFFSLKIFPLVVYFLIFFSFYWLCLKLNLSKNSSFVCSISFLLIPAASVSSFLVSTDLLLLFFWTLAMTALLKIRSGYSLINFFLLGVFLGLAFLAKYAAIYFLISFFILAFIDNKTLLSLKKNWVGLFVFFLTLVFVLLPNIYWNINNGWVTFSHTASNTNLQNLNLGFYEPFKFILSQILMVGPVLFFSFFYLFKKFSLDFENKFLLIFSLPIVFIVLTESLLVRANANWAAPALISIFIICFRLVENKKPNLIIVNYVANYFICVFLFFSIMVSSGLGMFDRIRGIDEFVENVLKTVGEEDVVVSDRIVFSTMVYEIRNKPNNIFMPFRENEKITNHFQISSPLSKTRDNNFYLIGNKADVSYLVNESEIRLLKEFDVPFSSSKLKFYEVVFK